MNGKIYTNQTGRFPIKSSRNSKYIMISYDYDSNTINVGCLKSRTRYDLKAACENIYKLLKSRGLNPKIHFLDNECAESSKTFMTEKKEDFQLVSPNIYRRNAAELMTQNFKNHFIAGLASVHKDYTLHLWCSMVLHEFLTLNLIRPLRIAPRLSAHTQLHGPFCYSVTPLTPPDI